VNNQSDIITAKLNTEGNMMWDSYWGNAYDDFVNEIAVDESGIYLLGRTELVNGDLNVFLIKYGTQGGIIYENTWGGENATAWGYGLALHYGEAYVCGNFERELNFGDQISLKSNGSSDMYVASINEEGECTWAENWGGPDSERALVMAIDSNSIYVAGVFSDDTSGFVEGEGNSSKGGADAYLMCLNMSGHLEWLKSWGSSGRDLVYDIAALSNDRLAVSGYVNGNCDFDPDRSETLGPQAGYISFFNSEGEFIGVYGWDEIIPGYLASQEDSLLVSLEYSEEAKIAQEDLAGESTVSQITDAFLISLEL
jgi:hypothetical protein